MMSSALFAVSGTIAEVTVFVLNAISIKERRKDRLAENQLPQNLHLQILPY
jgi:hypothetical protein